jgi:predicted metalloendopeptidase
MNFGGIGAVIGHELTARLRLTRAVSSTPRAILATGGPLMTRRNLPSRTQCIADQYSGYTAVDEVKLNGKLTLGENTADNGGLRIAYMALLATFAGREPAPVGWSDGEPEVLSGMGQCMVPEPHDAVSRMLANVDPHSPPKWRVNGTVSNMPEFREAYHCKADAPMVRDNACHVW